MKVKLSFIVFTIVFFVFSISNNLFSQNCGDGVMNGDEEGVDCGGTSCDPCPTQLASDCNSIYWINNGQANLNTADKNFESQQIIYQSEVIEPIAMILDEILNEIYFFDNGDHSIKKASVDGTNLQTLIVTNTNDVGGLALDKTNELLYWTERSLGAIFRADFTGDNVELVLENLTNPGGLEVDEINNIIYFTHAGNRSIEKVNTDGSNNEVLFDNLRFPRDVELDTTNGILYWCDAGAKKVQKGNIDGSNMIDLATTGLASPLSLTLDTDQDELYCTDWGALKIFRMNTDGTSLTSVHNENISFPNSVLVDTDDGLIYWIDWGNNKILSSDVNGGTINAVFHSFLSEGMAYHNVEDKLYFTNFSSNQILKSNVDGSQQEIIISGLSIPKGLVIDEQNDKLYWADSGAKTISSANADGTNIEILVQQGLIFPTGITLSSSLQKIYWSDSGAKKIQRSNFDGSNIEDIVLSNIVSPEAIIIDNINGFLFWADPGLARINRSDLDGKNFITLVNNTISQPKGLALDIFNQKLYWTDIESNRISRVNTDGTNAEQLSLQNDIIFPAAIATSSQDCYTIATDPTAGCQFSSSLIIEGQNSNDWLPLEDGSNTIVASINAKSNSLGDVTAEVFVDAVDFIEKGDFYLTRRQISVDASGLIDTEIQLRLFFTQEELDAVLEATGNDGNIDAIEIFIDAESCNASIGNVEGIVTILNRVAYSNGYYFEVSSDAMGSFSAGVVQAVLAVDFFDFKVSERNGEGYLEWKVRDQNLSSYYEIQKSVDAKNFEIIGEVRASDQTGEVRYSYVDKNLQPGIQYYRIAEIDIENKNTMSSVKILDYSGNGNFEIFPNPTSDRLHIRNNHLTAVNIQISNIVGELIFYKNSSAANTELDVSGWPSGVYVVQFIRENNVLSVEKLIVN